MTRTVSVVSGKGGVGKTTFSTNLALSLARRGKEVTLIDGDFSGANVSDHFGMEFSGATLNDVVKGDAYITQSVYRHSPRLSVIPADLQDYDFDTGHLKHAVLEFLGEKDFLVIDGPPGAKAPLKSVLESSNETVIVTEPVEASVKNASVIKMRAEEMGVDVSGVVLNKVFNDHLELSNSEVEELLDEKVIATLPHRRHVRESVVRGKPLVGYKPYSRVAKEINRVSYLLDGEEPPRENVLKQFRDGFLRLLD